MIKPQTTANHQGFGGKTSLNETPSAKSMSDTFWTPQSSVRKRALSGVLIVGLALSGGMLTGCSSSSEDPKEVTQKLNDAVNDTKEKLQKQLPKISFKPNDALSAEDNEVVRKFMEEHQLTQKSVEAMLALTTPMCSLLDGKQPTAEKNKSILNKIYSAATGEDQAQWYQMIHQVVEKHCSDKLPAVEQNKPQGMQ